MPSPNVWGPITWNLIHGLIEKLKEDKYVRDLFFMLRLLVSNLPCPSCSQHAEIYLSRTIVEKLKTKKQLKDLFFMFHNNVNARTKKPLFKYDQLSKYEDVKLNEAFNKFKSIYHTRGNMNLIMESFQRKMALQRLNKWFIERCHYFE